jgi:hypothetical protein
MRIITKCFKLAILSFFILLIACSSNQQETTKKVAQKEEKAIGTEKQQRKSVKQEKIYCEKFEMIQTIEGDTLKLSLDTDLPDFTDVMVSVSRSYKEKGDSESTYSIDYFHEKSTVKKWQSPQEINISDNVFKNKLQEEMDRMSNVGMPFQTSTISDEIEVSIVVPVNQSNPIFGKRNENLHSALINPSGLRTIKKEMIIGKPLGSNVSNIRATKVYASNLQKDGIYTISKETPLMPEYEPADPETALTKMKMLPPGSVITVLDIKMKLNSPWYQVEANSAMGQRIGEGWINSIALRGQDIKKH